MLEQAVRYAAGAVPADPVELQSIGPGLSVESVVTTGTTDQLQIRLPAFSLACRHDLMQHARLFGLQTVGTAPGGLPGLSADPLIVDSIVQQARAQFSATGFEASAVTALSAAAPAAPNLAPPRRVSRLTVSFDRPFGFVAVHRPSRLVLFAGWLADPRGVAPQPARHAASGSTASGLPKRRFFQDGPGGSGLEDPAGVAGAPERNTAAKGTPGRHARPKEGERGV